MLKARPGTWLTSRFNGNVARPQKIRRVLVANRGEIALRVMRTARKLGVESVAVYSDVDVHAQHTKFAEQAYRIGEAAPQKSYLCADRIIEVALKAGAQAVHPGYGFLSENAAFADKCEQNGLVFMGPPASAIRDMGMKNTAKKIMISAGVPVIEGYNGEEQSPELLFQEARRIGFPVMIKAVCGGGGKGMRIARTEQDFQQALESAKTESDKAFGNSDMIIEKFVERPRHVEVQVFGDRHQNYVYLWERDCSIQRRHQKVIEEAPAPGLTAAIRRSIGEAGANAARAVGYTGAGTVEFIMDPATQKFYFMEMNTRLQVEHPVTEAVTGVDLVEWQFVVAEGAPLPLSQAQIRLDGHALEARLYAEDSAAGFMPTAGTLHHLRFPAQARVDSGVAEGDEVTVHYDPMIAKVIVWGRDRAEAIWNLDAALKHTHIGGLANNVDFVRRCLNHPKFVEGQVYTDFIADHESELLPPSEVRDVVSRETVIEGAVARMLLSASTSSRETSPFSAFNSFRLNYEPSIHVQLDEKNKVEMIVHSDSVGGSEISALTIDGKHVGVFDVERTETEVTRLPQVNFRIEVDGNSWPVKAIQMKEGLQVFGCEQKEWPISTEVPEFDQDSGAEAGLQGRSPMPGVIDKVFVGVGDAVQAGQSVVVMIAMKMEFVLKSPCDCIVEAINCEPGQSVRKNAVLVKYNKSE